ncbi:DUF192 domain-containing protein [Fodinibius saliphilus]|uniref:DUF192 domain-containing protein n=1 Tax=Fodinibius saliphilus TaxID=1920650 RepID=UPI001FE72868|nr:DUF192 domain-containing protein [Fodinibius saliphilus]
MLLSACSQAQKKSNSKNTKKEGRTITFERSVSFLSTQGDTLSTVEVAIADEDIERNQGLMDVRDLPKSKGMLFIFENNEPRSFWMANTPLPLDIIFVNNNYEIVRIHHNTQPFSEKSFASEKPAKYVIETNAGYCIAHDIQEGMKVHL